jgi:hypothetical protein
VIKSLAFDAAGQDGMRLVVKGDGNRYKFRLKVNKPATSFHDEVDVYMLRTSRLCTTAATNIVCTMMLC